MEIQKIFGYRIKIREKIEQYSLKPNRREDINREPLMNAFSWTETEVNDWVCARPMNGDIEGTFRFPTLKGHLTRKKWDSLSPVEAYEVQNEKCAVCENFVMKLFTSGLIDEAIAFPKLQEQINVISLIDCDAFETIDATPSTYKIPLKFSWINAKETCEYLRSDLARHMTQRRFINL